MTINEIEALYIEHAPAFRELLGVLPEGPALAIIDEQLHHVLLWGVGGFSNRWALSAGASSFTVIPASLAVAAHTEAWRERLEKPGSDAGFLRRGSQLVVYAHGEYVGIYDSLPEAICGAVEALVAHKRAKDKDARLNKLIVPGVAERVAQAASLKEPLDPENPADSTDPMVVATDLSAEVAEIESSCARLRRILDMRMFPAAKKRAEEKSTTDTPRWVPSMLSDGAVPIVLPSAAKKRSEEGMEKMGFKRVEPNGAECIPAADDLKGRIDALEGVVQHVVSHLGPHIMDDYTPAEAPLLWRFSTTQRPAPAAEPAKATMSDEQIRKLIEDSGPLGTEDGFGGKTYLWGKVVKLIKQGFELGKAGK